MSQQILKILKELVACDTQNPPRLIGAGHQMYSVIREYLKDGFEFQVQDFGKGRVNLLAKRGNPNRLFNVHLDTVPIGLNWTRTPLEMTVHDNKAFGRGVCDIKGAAACLIDSAIQSDGDVAILFSSDEEGAESCCISEFCGSDLVQSFKEFVVAEPTGCLAIAGHRGYLSVKMNFVGESGHTSRHELLELSANHRATRWITAALDQVATLETATLNGSSACFNVGFINGGIKNNMVADSCVVTWSARMPAGFTNQMLLEHVFHDQPDFVDWKITFDGPPLPGNLSQREETVQRCQELSLPCGEDVDFWTEAALFAKTGLPVFVLGPGDIAQAHTADEWVAIEQLEKCAAIYRSMMN